MTYAWVATEMRTGRVICDLPDLTVEKIGVTLCDHMATNATLPIPDAPVDWRRAALPFGSVLVLLDDEVPVWGGIVTGAPLTTAATVSLSLATWEAYLGRRYVGDLSYIGAEQCYVAADVVLSTLDATTPLIVERTAGTTLRSISWDGSADKTILTCLQELSGLDQGPEWTISWRRLSSPERYVPVLTIADRIGTTVPAGLGPAATFEMPGPVTDFSYERDWASGGGATMVIATSTSDGDTRPQSDPQISADPDRPTVEWRYSPGEGLDASALNYYAAGALSVMRDGSASLSLTAIRSDAPRLGLDWGIGDQVGYHIEAPSVGVLDGVSRVIAWEATTSGVETITPILAAESTDGGVR